MSVQGETPWSSCVLTGTQTRPRQHVRQARVAHASLLALTSRPDPTRPLMQPPGTMALLGRSPLPVNSDLPPRWGSPSAPQRVRKKSSFSAHRPGSWGQKDRGAWTPGCLLVPLHSQRPGTNLSTLKLSLTTTALSVCKPLFLGCSARLHLLAHHPCIGNIRVRFYCSRTVGKGDRDPFASRISVAQ